MADALQGNLELEKVHQTNMLAKITHDTPPSRCISEERTCLSVFTSDAGHLAITTAGAA